VQELHAHLNGSLRDATVVDLLKAKRRRQAGATEASESDLPAYLFQHNRSLDECVDDQT
jgi:adenosine deaminase